MSCVLSETYLLETKIHIQYMDAAFPESQLQEPEPFTTKLTGVVNLGSMNIFKVKSDIDVV